MNLTFQQSPPYSQHDGGCKENRQRDELEPVKGQGDLPRPRHQTQHQDEESVLMRVLVHSWPELIRKQPVHRTDELQCVRDYCFGRGLTSKWGFVWLFKTVL